MSSCRFCMHFQRVNFKLSDININNVEETKTALTTDHYYEASYFPIMESNESIAWGVCKKTWATCKANSQNCDNFEQTPTSHFPLEDTLNAQKPKTSLSDVSSEDITTNAGLFAYYITNLCAKSISELKFQKHCVLCQYWAEIYNYNIDIPPAYIPYFETQNRCLINKASKGICRITNIETSSLYTCNCNNVAYKQLLIINIPSFDRRVTEARRKMRSLMRLEAFYIIHSFPENYEKGSDNGYHMRLFNSYNISNALEKSNKFLNITPSLFRGKQDSTYDTIDDHVTDPDSTRMHFNYTVIREFAQYYHISEDYLLSYTDITNEYDPDLSEFLLGSCNATLYNKAASTYKGCQLT